MLCGDSSGEEHRQREPPGHMTGEVHAGKEKGKEEQSGRHVLVLSPSLEHSHSLTPTQSLSHCDAFIFSMEAMRRKQV